MSTNDEKARLIREEMIHRGQRAGMDSRAIELMLELERPAAKADDSEAWNLGLRAAEFFFGVEPGQEWLAGLPADANEWVVRANAFVDIALDPMGPANMVWATSPVADDPGRYAVFAASYRAAVLKVVAATHVAEHATRLHVSNDLPPPPPPQSTEPILAGKVGVNRIEVDLDLVEKTITFVRHAMLLGRGREVTRWARPMTELCEVRVSGRKVTLVLDHPALGHRGHEPIAFKTLDDGQATRGAHVLAQIAGLEGRQDRYVRRRSTR